jgi:hypothetical protein
VKTLFTAAVLAAGTLVSAAQACDLDLSQVRNRLHAHITCGHTVTEDGNLVLSPKDKSKTCTTQIKGVEQIDRNIYYVHTHCDVDKTLVFQLVGGDTLRITNAENY